eukprot:781864_1
MDILIPNLMQCFFKQITRLNANGSQLQEMSGELFLTMAGLPKQDQCVLVKNIERITKKRNPQKNNKCGFCTINTIDTVMIPCGHQFSCDECRKKREIRRCPICRNPVNQIVKTYMAGF